MCGTDLRVTDSASYTCLAISSTGETSWTSRLLVRHPSTPSVVFHSMPDASTFPVAPSRPSVSLVTGTSVTLSWQPSDDDGASAVNSYTVEYYSQHCSTVRQPSRTHARTTRLDRNSLFSPTPLPSSHPPLPPLPPLPPSSSLRSRPHIAARGSGERLSSPSIAKRFWCILRIILTNLRREKTTSPYLRHCHHALS